MSIRAGFTFEIVQTTAKAKDYCPDSDLEATIVDIKLGHVDIGVSGFNDMPMLHKWIGTTPFAFERHMYFAMSNHHGTDLIVTVSYYKCPDCFTNCKNKKQLKIRKNN